MNLLARLDDLTSDDATVKAMFDHIRNLGLGVLVFGASSFVLAQPERFGFVVPTLIMGAILGIVGGVLIILNAVHGLKKAHSLTNPLERFVLFVVVNAIGPIFLGALMIVGPFRG